MVLPSQEVEEILTWPEQITTMLGAGSPSVHSFVPRVWLISTPILS
jgi:hypothetical protein